MRRMVPAVEAATVRIWLSMFTEQDLRDILAFHRFPMDDRMLTRMPGLMAAMAKALTPITDAADREMTEEIRRELVETWIEKAT